MANFTEYPTLSYAVIQAMDEGVIVLDGQWKIEMANSAALRCLGILRSADEVPGTDFFQLISPYPHLKSLLQEKLTSTDSAFELEPVYLNKRYICLKRKPFSGRFLLLLRDITESKKLWFNIISEQWEEDELEKQQLASSLHDDLGTLVNTLHLKFESYYYRETQANSKKEEEFSQIKSLIKTITQKIRKATFTIRADFVMDYGLKVALENMCLEFSLLYPIDVRFKSEGEVISMPKSLELKLYRIAVEMLDYTTKHVQPEHIILRLSLDEDKVQLSLNDDGKNNMNGKESTRLFNLIKTRISINQGSVFTMKSDAGPESRFKVVIPLEEEVIGQ